MSRRLLIAGCGDLGIRLAGRLQASDWQVAGLRRDTALLPSFITPLSADLSRPETLAPLDRQWDAVIYQATPGQRDEAAYHRTYVDALVNLLDRVRPHRLIFVSSTAVYGQDAGEWVDEQSETVPSRFNGRLVLDGERVALAAAAESLVVRFSGIYGPGREYLLDSVRSGKASCRPEPPQWTNRIHVDDCAAVLQHLLDLVEPAPVYCASDCRPAPRCEVLGWLSERLGVPPPRHLGLAEGDGQGKRISNHRLLASGFKFQFPDYQHGYGAMLS
jgi:nucleoside-diphosphate-sugar epimerase